MGGHSIFRTIDSEGGEGGGGGWEEGERDRRESNSGNQQRYSRNIGATKCKLIGKRVARTGTGKAGQRANIDALTMQANYVLVRAWLTRSTMVWRRR